MRYTPPSKQPFVQMAMPEANAACRPFDQESASSNVCAACEQRVILHCDRCKIQVSGCKCTLKKKIQQAEDLTPEEEQMAQAMGWKTKSRLWTPGMN